MARRGGSGNTALTCTFSSIKAQLIASFNSYGEVCQIIGLGGERYYRSQAERCSGKIKSQTNSPLTALKGTREDRTAGDIAHCCKTVV